MGVRLILKSVAIDTIGALVLIGVLCENHQIHSQTNQTEYQDNLEIGAGKKLLHLCNGVQNRVAVYVLTSQKLDSTNGFTCEHKGYGADYIALLDRCINGFR